MALKNRDARPNLQVNELLRRADSALDLPKGDQHLPPEDECLRVELAQRYVNLALSISHDTMSQP